MELGRPWVGTRFKDADTLSRGDMSVFFTRPISLVLLISTVIFLLAPSLKRVLGGFFPSQPGQIQKP